MTTQGKKHCLYKSKHTRAKYRKSMGSIKKIQY